MARYSMLPAEGAGDTAEGQGSSWGRGVAHQASPVRPPVAGCCSAGQSAAPRGSLHQQPSLRRAASAYRTPPGRPWHRQVSGVFHQHGILALLCHLVNHDHALQKTKSGSQPCWGAWVWGSLGWSTSALGEGAEGAAGEAACWPSPVGQRPRTSPHHVFRGDLLPVSSRKEIPDLKEKVSGGKYMQAPTQSPPSPQKTPTPTLQVSAPQKESLPA